MVTVVGLGGPVVVGTVSGMEHDESTSHRLRLLVYETRDVDRQAANPLRARYSSLAPRKRAGRPGAQNQRHLPARAGHAYILATGTSTWARRLLGLDLFF